MGQSGYERIRDRRQTLETNLDQIIAQRAQRRQMDGRLSHCIHTTEESMQRRGTRTRS